MSYMVSSKPTWDLRACLRRKEGRKEGGREERGERETETERGRGEREYELTGNNVDFCYLH